MRRKRPSTTPSELIDSDNEMIPRHRESRVSCWTYLAQMRVFITDEHVGSETAREQKLSLLSGIRRPSSFHPGGGRNIRHISDESVSIGRSVFNTLVAPSVEDLGLRNGNWKEDGGRGSWVGLAGSVWVGSRSRNGMRARLSLMRRIHLQKYF